MNGFRLLKNHEITCRKSKVNAGGVSCLLYPSKFAVPDILDETFGIQGWFTLSSARLPLLSASEFLVSFELWSAASLVPDSSALDSGLELGKTGVISQASK